MKLIDFIIMFLRKLSDFLPKETEKALVSGVTTQEIIDPEQSYNPLQIISPRVYEFTDEEKLSVLRLHDYVHLQQLNSENILQERG